MEPQPPDSDGGPPVVPPTEVRPQAVRFGDPANDEDRLWGMLAHLSNLFIPALGALVVYLIYKDKSKFVSYHAIQAFVAQGALWAVSGTIIGVTCGFGLPILLVPYVLAVVWGLKANKGEWTGFPIIDAIGR